MTGRRGRRCKQLLDDLKEKRGYWKLKEEALRRTVWRTRFGRGCGRVVRQTTEWVCKILVASPCRNYTIHKSLRTRFGRVEPGVLKFVERRHAVMPMFSLWMMDYEVHGLLLSRYTIINWNLMPHSCYLVNFQHVFSGHYHSRYVTHTHTTRIHQYVTLLLPSVMNITIFVREVLAAILPAALSHGIDAVQLGTPVLAPTASWRLVPTQKHTNWLFSSGTLRGVVLQLVTDVSVKPIVTIFQGHIPEEQRQQIAAALNQEQ
jgi:hypothetical protein